MEPEEGEDPAVVEAEDREVLSWLDMPMIFPEFVEGIARLAHSLPARQGAPIEAAAEPAPPVPFQDKLKETLDSLLL